MARNVADDAIVKLKIENAKLKVRIKQMENQISHLIEIVHLCRSHSVLSKDLLGAIEDALKEHGNDQ